MQCLIWSYDYVYTPFQALPSIPVYVTTQIVHYITYWQV